MSPLLLAVMSVACGPKEPPVPAGIPDDPTPEDIFEAQVRGLGGAEAIRSKDSYYVRVHSELQGPDVEMTIEMWGQAPDRDLMRTFRPDGTLAWIGYADGIGWRYKEGGDAFLEVGQELDEHAFSADFYGDLNYATRFVEASVEGMGSFDGKPAWVMRVVTSFGEEQRRWYESATGLMIGRTGMTDFPGRGEVSHNVHYTDYRDVDGVMVRMHTREEVGPAVLVSTVEEFKWDPKDLPDFEPPPPVQALLAESEAESG